MASFFLLFVLGIVHTYQVFMIESDTLGRTIERVNDMIGLSGSISIVDHRRPDEPGIWETLNK